VDERPPAVGSPLEERDAEDGVALLVDPRLLDAGDLREDASDLLVGRDPGEDEEAVEVQERRLFGGDHAPEREAGRQREEGRGAAVFLGRHGDLGRHGVPI